MHPLIIQAIATDQVRAIHEHAAARQRAAGSRCTRAGWPRRWLSWPGPGRSAAPGPAHRPRRDPRAA